MTTPSLDSSSERVALNCQAPAEILRQHHRPFYVRTRNDPEIASAEEDAALQSELLKALQKLELFQNTVQMNDRTGYILFFAFVLEVFITAIIIGMFFVSDVLKNSTTFMLVLIAFSFILVTICLTVTAILTLMSTAPYSHGVEEIDQSTSLVLTARRRGITANDTSSSDSDVEEALESTPLINMKNLV